MLQSTCTKNKSSFPCLLQQEGCLCDYGVFTMVFVIEADTALATEVDEV